MLQLDVEKRLTATEALAHAYFDQFRDIEEETEAQQSYDDSLEHEKLSIDEWRSKMLNFHGLLSVPCVELPSPSHCPVRTC
uniref:Protein kinase domain-containing protein n=1 Tax=Terrapene triunguis TaxID=2587831 RepID=A0A674JHN7_9SAUR